MKTQKKIQHLVDSFRFALAINGVIALNAILIGVETFYLHPWIVYTQTTIMGVFVVEILLRWIGKESVKSYFSNGWNLFDLIIVGAAFIPESMFDNSAAISVLRVVRVFRILRLVKTFPELQVIVAVLLKSIRSLTFTGMLFGILMYMYSVMGVVLFKLPASSVSPNMPDPYGSISEGFFTLFRILTGEDWTDLRYELLGVAHVPDWVVTTYHVSWMAVSAFLLINLVVGAVVNNYEQVMRETLQGTEEAIEEEIKEDIATLHTKIDRLEEQLKLALEKQSRD